MSKYRYRLPQLKEDALFMTDGGLETTLIFDDGIELPYFAAFHLLRDDAGTDILRRYFERYARMAVQARCWLASGKPHLARQYGLGEQTRLRRGCPGRCQSQVHRLDAGSSRRARDRCIEDDHQRGPGSARRWLQSR